MRLQKEIIPKDVLEEIIALGEGYKTEFQETLSSLDLTAQTICAFSNTKGGNIFIGITDKGNPVGISDEDEESKKLEKLFPIIIPKPNILASSIKFNKKALILIRVNEGNKKPYYINNHELLIPFIRVDNLNVPATKKVVKRFVRNNIMYGTGKRLSREEKIVLDLFGQSKKLAINQIKDALNYTERKVKKILRNLSRKSFIIPSHEGDVYYYYNSENDFY